MFYVKLIVIFFILFIVSSCSNNEVAHEAEIANKEFEILEESVEESEITLREDHYTIYGVTLGMTKEEVLATLGEPFDKNDGDPNFIIYNYGPMNVFIVFNRVEVIGLDVDFWEVDLYDYLGAPSYYTDIERYYYNAQTAQKLVLFKDNVVTPHVWLVPVDYNQKLGELRRESFGDATGFYQVINRLDLLPMDEEELQEVRLQEEKEAVEVVDIALVEQASPNGLEFLVTSVEPAPGQWLRVRFVISNPTSRIVNLSQSDFVIKKEGLNVVKQTGGSAGLDVRTMAEDPYYNANTAKLYPGDEKRATIDFRTGSETDFSGYVLYYIYGQQMYPITPLY